MTVTTTFDNSGPTFAIKLYPGVGDIEDIVTFTEPLPMLPNFNVHAYMSWTSRQVIAAGSSLLNPFMPQKMVLHMETKALLPTSNDATPGGATTSSMSFIQRERFPTKFIEDYTSNSLLDGLSTVGGFWTFLDGTFALLFGASALYFFMGKRSLSALGLGHVFQRSKLMENWREDFPTVHTEGGQPGSETAGVVAFIRDRLLDIEEGQGSGPKGSDIESPGV
ncbi:hypothetical protein B0H19DRAFT_1157323 [Mycena capillaripes]|nr:hypothetical protein B0H19DRAFT_1157323 [Mycena capillaripes]